MAKRKASNDDSRFKNAQGRYQNLNSNAPNIMQPFLDQSIDFGTQNKGMKQHPDKRQGTPLLNDSGRPKTSTGGRAYHKMNQMEDSGNMTGIAGQMHNQVPTKTPNIQNSKPSIHGSKYEKNDQLRTQLRRSYDANSGNLPHAHGIQPMANFEKKYQNRPNSSTKIHQMAPKTNSTTNH